MATSNRDERRTTSHLAATSPTQLITPKITSKLKSLVPTASKETLQTHSKWILFHSTRHGSAICKSLLKTLLQSCRCENVPSQQREREKGDVYLTIIHEMVIMYNDKASEWSRHSKFRLRLGKTVLHPFLEKIVADLSYKLTTAVTDSLKTMVVVWKNLDCFTSDDDSAIFIDDISRLVLQIDSTSTNDNNLSGEGDIILSKSHDSQEGIFNDSNTSFLSTGTPEKEKEGEQIISLSISEDVSMNNAAPLTPTETDDDIFGLGNDEDDENRGDAEKTNCEKELKSPQELTPETVKKVKKNDAKKTSHQNTIQEKEFDFESEGIPYNKVEINQLQPPCKSIATVQITRDLHSDTAQSLLTLLSTVPDPVLKECQDTLTQPSQKGKGDEIDLNALPLISDPVLDLNLKQDLSNVRAHRDIILKQKVAREALVNLLIQSRCKFGSKETAELYYGMRETIDRLQSCKSKVLDAMELEGLDRDGIDDDGDSHGDMKETGDDGLKDFEWLTREEVERESKRIRLDEGKS